MTIQKPAEQTRGSAELGPLQACDGVLYVYKAACCRFVQPSDQIVPVQDTVEVDIEQTVDLRKLQRLWKDTLVLNDKIGRFNSNTALIVF